MELVSSSLNNHIVILGFNSRVEALIRDIRRLEGEATYGLRPVLVILPEEKLENSLPSIDGVYFLFGHDTDPAVFRRANIRDAHILIVPDLDPGETSDDSAKILPILTARSVHPELRVCWEVSSGEVSSALLDAGSSAAMGTGVEIVSSPHLAHRMIAGTIRTPSFASVIHSLLNFSGLACLQAVVLSPAWKSKSLDQCMRSSLAQGVIVLGYQRGGLIALNPLDRSILLESGDIVWCLAPRDKPLEQALV